MVTRHHPIVGPASLLISVLLAGAPAGAPSSHRAPAPAGPERATSRQEPAAAADIGFATAEQRSRWRLHGDGYEVGFDSQEMQGRGQSLRLALSPGAVYHDGAFAVASARLAIDDVRGKHLRLAAWIKSSAIAHGWAGLWVRVDGPGGVLAFDNMGDRGAHGTTAWSYVEVEMDVAPEAAGITLGALLAGDGTAWVRDVAVFLDPLFQTVDGKVLDPQGRPVGGALVAAIARDAGGLAATARSDPGGTFRVVVPAGRVTLTATARGFAAALLEPVENHAGPAREVAVELGQGGPRLLGELKAAEGLPPAGSRVVLTRFQQDGGGTFLGELDGSGRFAVQLPQGTYQVTLDGAAYRLSPGVVQLGADDLSRRVTIRASRLVPAPEEVVDWLRLHLAPLRSTAPGAALDDLRPLAAMVGKARLVGLGEATHGTREFFQLKHRLLELLVSEMGFTVFAIEANWPESLAIDDYVLRGKGDPAEALGGLFFIWNTEEVLDMIRWMRAFNADPAHLRKVRFFGFDMQFAGVARRFVAAYLAKVDAGYAGEMGAQLAAFPDDPHRAARAASAAALITARALGARLDAHKDAYVARSSQGEWDLARQHAVILEQSAALAAPRQADDRDRAMADNVGWILAHQPPGTRMVVWGHNAHVGYGPNRGGYTPMGEFLREKLGSDYRSVGFLFDQGAFQSMRPGGQGLMGLHELSVGPSPVDTLAAAFHRTGLRLALLDLHSCPTSGPVGAWLAAPHAVREAGAFFFGEEQMWTIPAVITDRFDALLYVDRTTRARPALARSSNGAEAGR